METKTDKEVYRILGRYLTLKTAEKEVRQQLDDLKCAFYAAADAIGSDQIVIGDALIYKTSRASYDYPEAILKAEKNLKAMKKAFEAKNAPAAVSVTWAVKI